MLIRMSAIAVFICSAGIGALAADTEVTSPGLQRMIMQDLSQSIQKLIQISLGTDSSYSKEDHDAALFEADKLIVSSQMVEDHVGNDSNLNRKFGISLSEEIEQLREAVERNERYSVDFHLISVIESCVGCHARLPRDESEDPSFESFQVSEDLQSNPAFLSKLHIATRQFGRAMDGLESHIRSHASELLEVDRAGILNDYLWIAVRSAGETERARKFLLEIRKSIAMPNYLSNLLDRWISDLADNEPLLTNDADQSDTDLQLALGLIDQSRHATQVPFGREGLITDLLAARLLETMLSSASPPSDEDLAEVYYQLGLIEARLVGISYASPYMEYLFEAAIRAHPAGARAVDALRILEEYGVYVALDRDSRDGRELRTVHGSTGFT